jgi:hypothetical protein
MDLNPNRPRGMVAVTLVAASIIVVALASIGILSTVFHRAYVTVTPHRFDVAAQATLESAIDSPTLPYQKASNEDTVTKSVPATGSKHAEDRASGTITVYNAYSTKSERLITNTRFAAKNGLIYRVHNAVVVPGYTTKAGLKVPGAIDITVYADEPGEKYNVGLAEFTIPGLKGSKQFDLMMARSKTPIAGGFIGERAVVDEKIRSDAVESLRAELDRTLRAKLKSSVPEGNVVFDSSIAVTFAEGPDAVDGQNALLSVSGSAVAPMFDANAFAHALAQATGVDFEGKLVVENPADLDVRVSDPTSVLSGAPFALTVSGTAKILALFDNVQLAKDLAGKPKSGISTVTAGHPAIEKIEVSVYPFWRGSTIPGDPSKITIDTAGEGSGTGSLDR